MFVNILNYGKTTAATAFPLLTTVYFQYLHWKNKYSK